MRTTVTLDEDVAAKLRAEARRTGKPFKEVLNECLRIALSGGRRRTRPASFRIETRDLGALRPGLSLDNVAELLDLVEGPESR
jgi:hypothetical protein